MSFVPPIVEAARSSRAVVVTAEPGAGKTTRVPPALTGDGPAILLQPRRVAARSIAARIAFEQGWTIGQEIGWQIRFERRFGKDTRLLVATEGILTARLQQDPLLSSFTTIVLDEFHERSIHADLAIALAKQAWRARTDLRIVVMSATIDAQSVAAFLDDCPIVAVPGRLHPLTIDYAPGESVAQAAEQLLARATGDVLCFQPGAFEIRRAVSEIEARVRDVEIVPLYGALDAADQDRALRESSSSLPACDRRDQHRGNVGDRAGSHGGCRFRIAEGRALRRGARHRQSHDRADHSGFGRSARGARRTPGAGAGPEIVGCARSAAAASRTGDPQDRSRVARARCARLGHAVRIDLEWFETSFERRD